MQRGFSFLLEDYSQMDFNEFWWKLAPRDREHLGNGSDLTLRTTCGGRAVRSTNRDFNK